MISGIGNGYAGQTDDIALVLSIRVLIRNKEIDLFSPAVEMLLQQAYVVDDTIDVRLVNVAKEGNSHKATNLLLSRKLKPPKWRKTLRKSNLVRP